MRRVLALNLGSSSLKLTVLDSSSEAYKSPPTPIWSESLTLKPEDSLDVILSAIVAKLPPNIDCLVHRVVHGGSSLLQTVNISPEVKSTIHSLAEFAPLHNPRALSLINASEKYFAQPQFAAFDTAFFSTLSDDASTYALPKSIRDQGIRRYGFHGLSHSYCSKRLSALLGTTPEKIISLHLGSGCSMAAIRDGKAIYSTMGFTPLEGLVMGTRSGSIDPGVILHLAKKYPVEELESILTTSSGLLGLSEQTSDMRTLLSLVETKEALATLAYQVFLHSLVTHVGSCFALLNGADAVIFTGGIGENSKRVIQDLISRCSFLPQRVFLEDEKLEISGVFVIKAREEIEMSQLPQ